ncbi:MarR family transcriptional regulator [Fredinandcohnia sp. QZ13]|uniref:MarR family winged helix-turn-helix transcriptional regulator n=1 Tax=Bacillaceae TaxID=186817 RepID=UPI0026B2EBCC|nr:MULTISPECIES: MarR family transcriptional regulator [Bacillaceae]MDR4888090.1 MarR family transcriptional regulator [Fredinandcohnia sp. QZ13]
MYRPFESQLNVELSKHQLYRAQWSILYYIVNFGSPTLVEISNYLGVEKPTVTRTINRLEELGYVEHIPGKDKREKRMQLTVLGKKVYQDVRKTVDEFEKEIIKGVSEKELLEAVHVMKAIRNNLIK